MIIVQAPLRISLFGGGTDFPDYFCSEGGCVLTSAIDKYIFVTIKNRFDNMLRIGYTMTEMVEHVSEIQHDLIRESLQKAGIQSGVEITTMGDIPSAGSGLGSSSTVTVGALHAMYTYLNESVPMDRLAREACQIEVDILKKPIGYQDQYIAAYGGFKFIEFKPGNEISISRINLEPDLFRHLDDNLMLFFTGATRKAGSILEEQQANISQRLPILRELKGMAYQARDELQKRNLDGIGRLLDQSWTLKKQLASKISNSAIDEVYEAACKAGALGGKITGAGGGGFILFYCPRERQEKVRTALNGMRELPFHLEQDGTKVIFNYRR
jgi:D-glycero-alpha-D-manno-heptose-7-phosphate kinase